MKKAISVKTLLSIKFDLAPFEGEWLEHLGRPALQGIWFVYGKSGSGKTTYCYQLAKYLTQFVRLVHYNSLEERVAPTTQSAAIRNDLIEVDKKLKFLDGENLTELRKRLKKKKSPDVVFIDSVLYLDQYTAANIISLRHEFPKKLFILIGQEKDGEAKGSKQVRIKHDADIKIRVVGGVAHCTTRYATEDGKGGKPYVVFEELKKEFNAEL